MRGTVPMCTHELQSLQYNVTRVADGSRPKRSQAFIDSLCRQLASVFIDQFGDTNSIINIDKCRSMYRILLSLLSIDKYIECAPREPLSSKISSTLKFAIFIDI